MSTGMVIFLTLAACTLARTGTALLKLAARDPHSPARKPLLCLVAVATSKAGLLGLLLQVCGCGLLVAAFSAPSAPISVLQPLRAFGVVVMALLSVTLLHERLENTEWLGVTLCLAGVILLSISAATVVPRLGRINASGLLAYRASLGLLGAAIMCLLVRSKDQARAEILFGLLVGILLGLGYMHIKATSLAWFEDRMGEFLLSLLMASLGLLAGLGVLVISFRSGRAMIVTTVNFVVNQAIVIAGGWLCFGEQLPNDMIALCSRCLGLGAILLGTLLFASVHLAERCSEPVGRETSA